ncbi:hypothetical protein GCM10011610_54810 [Nocardia rhizosphaerihabitans]|uniref:Cupin type-2 domain-containing protein n=2 Tax=Nocardia rhizosphaerihabitans TaxID=1691570 RepID=A0ABQ2KVS9_9NOCA|nr:hypothetical protein GCM10011610_54810 [Nocardia rhizosphaerihabitans]
MRRAIARHVPRDSCLWSATGEPLTVRWLPSRAEGADAPLVDHDTSAPPDDQENVMSAMIRKNFDDPEETRPFEQDKGRLDLVNLDSGPVGRAVFEPGWRWSEHVKPIAQTDSCQAPHMGYCLSGKLAVVMDDGEQQEFGPGDLMVVPPGHDAWVVGDEPCVMLDWQGVADYAKR